MKGLTVRWLAAGILTFVAVAPAGAYNPDPPRDPRAIGLAPIWARTRGDEVIRVDRWPDGTPRRCVRAARLATPEGGGPSQLEFGVERATHESADVTMYFRVRYLDAPDGKPMTVRDPILEMQFFGPTVDWRLETTPDGWVRRSKSAGRSDDDERDAFINEVGKPGNSVVSTFPDGTHRLHRLRGGVSFWHLNMFVDCACRLAADLPKETRDWLLCPEPRRN